jgi:copper chaperone
MTCEGCSNAVKRILGKIEGVQSVETDVAAKLVSVKGTAAPDVLLTALQKWGTAAGKTVALKSS